MKCQPFYNFISALNIFVFSETSDIATGPSLRIIISASWWCSTATVRMCPPGITWCRGDLVAWLAFGAGYHWSCVRSSWV